jgi:hypothetical protein
MFDSVKQVSGELVSQDLLKLLLDIWMWLDLFVGIDEKKAKIYMFMSKQNGQLLVHFIDLFSRQVEEQFRLRMICIKEI